VPNAPAGTRARTVFTRFDLSIGDKSYPVNLPNALGDGNVYAALAAAIGRAGLRRRARAGSRMAWRNTSRRRDVCASCQASKTSRSSTIRITPRRALRNSRSRRFSICRSPPADGASPRSATCSSSAPDGRSASPDRRAGGALRPRVPGRRRSGLLSTVRCGQKPPACLKSAFFIFQKPKKPDVSCRNACTREISFW